MSVPAASNNHLRRVALTVVCVCAATIVLAASAIVVAVILDGRF